MGTLIAGVVLTPLKIINGELGSVMHAIRSGDDGYTGFGEAYFSTVNQHAVKGWKCHKKMVLNIIVPVGSIRFVIFDNREHSQTKGNLVDVTLGTSGNYQRLTVPPGVWMAFSGIGEYNLLMNFASIPHDPAEAENLPLENDRIPKINWE